MTPASRASRYISDDATNSASNSRRRRAAGPRAEAWDLAYEPVPQATPEEIAAHKAALLELPQEEPFPREMIDARDEVHFTRIASGFSHVMAAHANSFDSIVASWDALPRDLQGILTFWIIDSGTSGTRVVQRLNVDSTAAGLPQSIRESILMEETYRYATKVVVQKVILESRWNAYQLIHGSENADAPGVQESLQEIAPEVPDLTPGEIPSYTAGRRHVKKFSKFFDGPHPFKLKRGTGYLINDSLVPVPFVWPVHKAYEPELFPFVDIPIMAGSEQDTTPPHLIGQYGRGYFATKGPKGASLRAVPIKLVRAQETIRTFVDPATGFTVARLRYVGGALGYSATAATTVQMPGKSKESPKMSDPLPSNIQKYLPGEASGTVLGQLQSYRIRKTQADEGTPLPLRWSLFVVLAVFEEFRHASLDMELNPSDLIGESNNFDPYDHEWEISAAHIHAAHDQLIMYLAASESDDFARDCRKALASTLKASLAALPGRCKFYGYPIISFRGKDGQKGELYTYLRERLSIPDIFIVSRTIETQAEWAKAVGTTAKRETSPPESFPAVVDYRVDDTHHEYDAQVAKFVLGRACTTVFGGPLGDQRMSEFYESAGYTMRRLVLAYLRIEVGKFDQEDAEHWATRGAATAAKTFTDTVKVEMMLWLRKINRKPDFHTNFRLFTSHLQTLIDEGIGGRWGKVVAPDDKDKDKATASALGSAVSLAAVMYYVSLLYSPLNATSPSITSRLDHPSQVPFVDPNGTPGDTALGGLIRLLAMLSHITLYRDPIQLRTALLEALAEFEAPLPLEFFQEPVGQVTAAPKVATKPGPGRRRRRNKVTERVEESSSSDSSDDGAGPASDSEDEEPMDYKPRPMIYRVMINHQTIFRRPYSFNVAVAIEAKLRGLKAAKGGSIPFDVSIIREGYDLNIQCTQGRLATPVLTTVQYQVNDVPDDHHPRGHLDPEDSVYTHDVEKPDMDVRREYNYEPIGSIDWDDLEEYLKLEVSAQGTIGSTRPRAYEYIRENLLEPILNVDDPRSQSQVLAEFDVEYMIEQGWIVWLCADELQTHIELRPADDWGDSISAHQFVLCSPSQAFSAQTNMTTGYNNNQGARVSYAATTLKGTLGGSPKLLLMGHLKKGMCLVDSSSSALQTPGMAAMGSSANADTNYAVLALGSWKGAQIEDCMTASQSLVRSRMLGTMLITTIEVHLQNSEQSFDRNSIHGDTREAVYRKYLEKHPELTEYPYNVTAVAIGTQVKTGDVMVARYSLGSTRFAQASQLAPHYEHGVVVAVEIVKGRSTFKNGGDAIIATKVRIQIATPRDLQDGVKPTTPASQKGEVGMIAPDSLFPHIGGKPLHLIAGATGEPSRQTPSRMFRWMLLYICGARMDHLYIDGFCALRMPNDPVFAKYLEDHGIYLTRTLRDSKGREMGTAGVGFQEYRVTSHHAASKFQVVSADEVTSEGRDPGSMNNRKGRKEGNSRVAIGAQDVSMLPADPQKLHRFLAALIKPGITNARDYPVCITCQAVGFISVTYNGTETQYRVQCALCGGYVAYTKNLEIASKTDGAKFGRIQIRHTLIQMSRYLRGLNVEFSYQMALYHEPHVLTYKALPDVI